jgi:hypothetical protein
MKNNLMLVRSLLYVLGYCLLSPALHADAPDVWTVVNDNDTAASYSPGMETREIGGYFDNDLHSSQKVGDWAEFSFVGTGVKWIGAKNDNHGDADVYIDGKLDATVSSTAPT